MLPDTEIVEGIEPKHEQLRHVLEKYCTEQLSPGDVLPSERALCEQYAVSRITVREAIGQLVADGLLVRVHGKGTFVAAHEVRSQLHLASFHEDMRKLGLTPSTAVLAATEDTLPADTAQLLGRSLGDKGFHIRRLRLANGLPMSVDDSWLDGARFPGLLHHDLGSSLYELFEREYGCVIDEAEQTVGAIRADAGLASVLGIAIEDPILSFDRTSSSDGVPVEHTVSYYRGDRYRVQMSLRNRAG
ncbi:GntR family transcriptional regulator [Gordonia jinhuaensis]|uniref:Transcriptional regulator n=1 Tax=Gordonia jinhuaensis TaxID=1517702 RepID=A0A916SWR2_9ACTN|nr:GntR family transcriptional regulator [Gordonia jinhuaensis]GGB19570.1 transcriptional regulator [Gordonia jinhuaensis]